jgi:hypothetical protein
MVEITQFSEDTLLYEVPTINKIRDFSRQHKNCEILYLHTKVTTHPKNSQNINDWIDMMLYFLLEQWPVATDALKDHCAVGCNYHNYDSSSNTPSHFSGNFWWAKSELLETLPECGPDKYDADFWLLQNNPTIKCLHYTPINHYLTLYPPENYR